MSQTKLVILILLALVVVTVVNSALYTVHEREKVIIVRFGKVIRFDDKPGLHFKVPYIDQKLAFDARLLTFDATPKEILTGEKKYVIVDYFLKWRIADPLKYFLKVGGREEAARRRLEPLIDDKLRAAFGGRKIRDVISGDRVKLTKKLEEAAGEEAKKYGIGVVDFRIKRVDLPPEVSDSVYNRMKSERKRIANELRAQGDEEAKNIIATAEKEKVIILAKAYRKAQRFRGDGDGRATAIYARAYRRYPEFYAFYRSLDAYKASFNSKSDIIIIDPSSKFFRYLKQPRQPR